MKTDFNAWLQDAHKKISQSIAECYNTRNTGGWQENHITTQVLNNLMRLGTHFDWEQYAQRTRWEAYKLSGHNEYSNGDIGLIVNIRLPGDTFIKGVAFYEAKKQYFDGSGKPIGFKALKSSQINRLRTNTYASSILFYDVDVSRNEACSVAVPTVFVSEMDRKGLVGNFGRVILHYGKFWSLSLGENLRGFSLDYRSEAIAALEEYALSKQAPSILLNVGVGMTSILDPELDSYCANLENYELIESDVENLVDPPDSEQDDSPEYR